MVAVVLVGLLAAGLMASPAAAEPSEEQVRQQQRQAARLAAIADAQAGRTEQARGQLAVLAEQASRAFEEYDVARLAAQRARERAAAARAREREARHRLRVLAARLADRRTDLGRYASAAYRDGGAVGKLASASALLQSGDVADLGRRISILEWVGTQQGRAVDRLELVEAAQADATREAAEAAAEAAAQKQIADAEELKASEAKARADALVADQQSVVQALAQAETNARDAASQAKHKAARMAQARRLAEQRRIEQERQRQADINAGFVVTPTGDCAGADISGYPNGQIPRSALCPLWGTGGHVLRADAAAAFNAMSKAYAADWGRPVCVTDSYRSYEMQVDLKRRKPYLAAVPGTSNHGWGRAVDLCDGVNSYNTPTYNWMKQNAPRFGWYHPSWAEPSGSKPEPWHWEFGG